MPESDVLAVVVNHNAGEMLVESLGSLARSTIPLRTVVVDNASTDGSFAAAEAAMRGDARFSFVANATNEGFARANNQALATARARYYVLVNPDCVVGECTIETMVRALDDDPGIGLASCVIRNGDGSVQKTCRRRFPTPWTALMRVVGLSRRRGVRYDFDYGDQPMSEAIERVEAISGAFMVARAAAVAEVGLLDEGYFLHCEDLDWCKRFADHGYDVAFVAGAEVRHIGGVSGRGLAVNFHLHRGMLRFYRKHYRDRYPAPLFPLVLAGVVASFVVRSAVIGVERILALFRRA